MITIYSTNGWVDLEAIDGRMDPTEKAEWTAALRSGKYEQGRGRLKRRAPHKKSRFCCLGVRCDIKNIEITNVTEYNGKDSKRGEVYFDFDQAMSYLPKSAEITLDNGRVIDGSEPFLRGSRFDTLASLNDAGLTFDQIADLIDYFL